MTQEEKIKYFTMASSFCNLGFTDMQVELLVEMYDLVLLKEGQTDLHSLVDTKFKVLEKHEKIALEKLAKKHDIFEKTKE